MSIYNIQSHLRQYAEDGIQQKVRIGNMIKAYQEQADKTRERIIDQNSLINNMKVNRMPSEKIELAEKRLAQDNKILSSINSYLEDAKEESKDLTMSLSAHMEELSSIEISAGGFVTHPIGVNKKVKLDNNKTVISFEPGGSVEIPIGVRLSKWKDSSQMTIKKTKKAGN